MEDDAEEPVASRKPSRHLMSSLDCLDEHAALIRGSGVRHLTQRTRELWIGALAEQITRTGKSRVAEIMAWVWCYWRSWTRTCSKFY